MKIFYSWKELVEMKARDAIKETAERNKWMQEEIARLREDAERYRWLRSWVNRMDELEAMHLQEPKSPEEADAIIIREILKQAEEIKLRIGEDV